MRFITERNGQWRVLGGVVVKIEFIPFLYDPACCGHSKGRMDVVFGPGPFESNLYRDALVAAEFAM